MSNSSRGVKTPIGVSDGGTGQTDATEGFDSLAPTTTKGDIIVSNGTDNIRLAVGANDTVLTADSTQASGVKWAAAAGGGGGGGAVPLFNNDSTVLNGPAVFDAGSWATTTITNQRMNLVPWYVSADCTLDYLTCAVSTAAAGATLRMGLYDNDSGPVNLVAESASISAATTGIKDSAALSTALTAGWYWLAITVDNNGGTVVLQACTNYKSVSWPRIFGSGIQIYNYAFVDSIDPASSLPDPCSSVTWSASNLMYYPVTRLTV